MLKSGTIQFYYANLQNMYLENTHLRESSIGRHKARSGDLGTFSRGVWISFPTRARCGKSTHWTARQMEGTLFSSFKVSDATAVQAREDATAVQARETPQQYKQEKTPWNSGLRARTQLQPRRLGCGTHCPCENGLNGGGRGCMASAAPPRRPNRA